VFTFSLKEEEGDAWSSLRALWIWMAGLLGWLVGWLVPAARVVAFLRINKQYLHMKGLRALLTARYYEFHRPDMFMFSWLRAYTRNLFASRRSEFQYRSWKGARRMAAAAFVRGGNSMRLQQTLNYLSSLMPRRLTALNWICIACLRRPSSAKCQQHKTRVCAHQSMGIYIVTKDLPGCQKLMNMFSNYFVLDCYSTKC
jgi:hypothetical protein